MLAALARTYSAAFAPEFFVLLCVLLAVGYEWRGTATRTLAGLGARVGTVGVAWALAFAVYRGLPALLGPLPPWGSDAAGSVGLAAGMVVIAGAWTWRAWGAVVPGLAAFLLAVTVPHLLVTPVWDVSSHVLYAAAPAGFLSLLDRRFVPLVALALGMVVSRPLAGAHTWAQSVGGLLLAAGLLGVFVARVAARDAV